MQQQMKKLQDDLEEQQRDNDELKFDYDRTTKEVRCQSCTTVYTGIANVDVFHTKYSINAT